VLPIWRGRLKKKMMRWMAILEKKGGGEGQGGCADFDQKGGGTPSYQKQKRVPLLLTELSYRDEEGKH